MSWRRIIWGCLLLFWLSPAWAGPSGPDIRHGDVQIQHNGNTTTIIQGSQRAIINWNQFNIDINELVQFIQPDQLSAVLNRVVGGDPSIIAGQLSATGRVFLINPSGILFTPTSQVNVGGLLASTLSLTDQDFLSGNYLLQQDPSFDLAAVVNQGRIEVTEGGFVALFAPLVSNEGLIVARSGQVALGATQRTTVNFDGQGLIEFVIPDGKVENPGTILLPQQAASELLTSVVSDPGIAEATSLPAAEGVVLQAGEIDVSGDSPGKVLLNSSQASLVTGQIRSDGEAGGEILVLSEGTSFLNGLLSASGTKDGGFVELSGDRFIYEGSVDVSGGETAGVFLLDPNTVTIFEDDPNSPTTGDLDPLLPTIQEAAVGSFLSDLALESQPPKLHHPGGSHRRNHL